MENADTGLPGGAALTGATAVTEAVKSEPSNGDSFFVSAPTVSMPKGGGAIKGIGERLSVNPVTGTGSLAVPIETSPGRAGMGPQLSLTYDSGAGNGVVGLGWQLTSASVTRMTDKGIPSYLDTEETDRDVFLVTGHDEMVAVEAAGVRFEDRSSAPGYVIHRYRPRVESQFARTERWTRVGDPTDVHWRNWSRDDVLTVFGRDANSRITDPDDPQRIYSWLICEMRDVTGNVVLYDYKGEDATNVDLGMACEINRGMADDPRRKVNRYLKNITYGNRVPLLGNDGTRPTWLTKAQVDDAQWMFEVVFDYGEHDDAAPKPGDNGDWPARRDAFSTRRAGFEIRTHRLCRRVLMFHHFPAEPGVGTDCLVRSTSLGYNETAVAAYLSSVTPGCHRRVAGGYLTRTMPPLEFDYSQPVVGTEIADVDAASLENLPTGAWGPPFRWADLDGEGLTGLLSEQSGGLYYKRNESPLSRTDSATSWDVRFAPLEAVPSVPGIASLASPSVQLMDLAGDGRLDVVEFDMPIRGFYARDDDGWRPLRAFEAIPNVAWSDPHLRFIDLTGDGLADILITDDRAFAWHASLGERGFAAEQRSAPAADEELGAKAVFADATVSIQLADMSGDGLADIVSIRNGEVCYWPNLGYGRFGPRIPMDGSPWLGSAHEFDARRVRLVDIDGSGPTDLLYLGASTTQFWVNQAGNGFSGATELTALPPVDDIAAVTTADVFGNGTAALVWSSPLTGDSSTPMKVLNLMAEGKPHLLTEIRNNLGAETHVHYAPSTYFYLKDRAEGRPWITRLPFPVHVIERVEVYDRISRNRSVTQYSYHHGHFDGCQREFRGFGRVDQIDTEDVGALRPDGAIPTGVNFDESSWIPPILTRTWFHTGVYAGRDRISRYFAGLNDAGDVGEYYREPGWTDEQARDALLEDTDLPDGLTAQEEIEACRALKGSLLRQEVYALDGTAGARHPYLVTEHNYGIVRLQPKGRNRNGVFFAHDNQSLTHNYERNPADPRVAHQMTLEIDGYGNVVKEVAIAYGRRAPVAAESLRPVDHDRQAQTLITYTEHRTTNAVDTATDHRVPLRCETRGFELTGYPATGTAGRYRPADFVSTGATPGSYTAVFDSDIAYEQTPTVGRQRRCVDHARTLFRPNDFGIAAGDTDALLPLGTLQSLALQGQSYRLVFTPGLLTQVYTRNGASLLGVDPGPILADTGPGGGGYVDSASLTAAGLFPATDAGQWWWIPSGRAFLSPATADTATVERDYARTHFHLPHRYRGTFGHTSTVAYDPHHFLVVDTVDPAGNRVTAGERTPTGALDPTKPGNDYRVLMPARIMDTNRNRIHVVYDTLGMVAATAMLGKPETNIGDSLAGLDPDPAPAAVLAAMNDPLANPAALLADATSRVIYDVFAYQRTRASPQPQPVVAFTISRETHASEPAPPGGLRLQVALAFWDGFGQEIQRKVRAEAGPVPVRNPAGAVVVGADGQPQMTPFPVDSRWVGSGWTVFNNKGKPVRQFEPFFTDQHGFEFDVRIGVSPVICYDPLSRVVATLFPDHTWTKLRIGAWRIETWDTTDTLTITDPATDPDTGDFFRRLEPALYLPTWLTVRQGGGLGPAEQASANASVPLAQTPTASYTDSMGRTILTVVHNKTNYSDAPAVATFPRSAVQLDIQGNSCAYTDAEDRLILSCDYDMTGRRVRYASMDAGIRWVLGDATAQPLHTWNERHNDQRTEYDVLRRPVATFLAEMGAPEKLVGKTIYGESLPAPEVLNQRGQIVQTHDQAGIVTAEEFDFKGNPVSSTRQLARDYEATLDWSLPVPLNPEVYRSRSRFDAMNRIVQSVTPADPVTNAGVSVAQPSFNEAGLLEAMHLWLEQAAAPAALLNPATADEAVITNIDYDARGRRTRIDYGNRCSTRFEFDPITSRLRRLVTTRDPAAFPSDCPAPAPIGWPGCQIQDLRYTYDPSAHVTAIHDNAQQTIFFANRRVDPDTTYTYDAIGQLIEATGREQLGAAGVPRPHDYNDAARTGLPAIGDGNAVGGYRERYVYDLSGNIAALKHVGTNPINPGWTRDYVYAEPSRLQPTKLSNRLTRTVVGTVTETYSNAGNGYDAHGNLLRAPQLQAMQWDGFDRLAMTQRQAVNGADTDGITHAGERTYYVYDGAGARVRKVTRAASGQIREERIYLNGMEIARRYGVNTLTRETLHINDGTRRVAMVQTRTQGNEPGIPARTTRYQLTDHLSSSTLEVDENAAVVSYEQFTPYGSSAYQAVGTAVEVPKRYRFTGKERDAETGMAYHGARYYAPWLGRWITPDPIGIADGANLYSYVHNNPMSGVDPTGTDDKPITPSADWQADLKRLAGQASDGPVLYIAPDGSIHGVKTASMTYIYAKGGTAYEEPQPESAPLPPQQPPPEPDHHLGFYPMTQAKEQLTTGAIESFKRGEIVQGLIGWGLSEFMKPFETAEQLMPYNIPDHFLSAGQYAKRWIWYDMRGQSGTGLLELAKGHGEAAAAVGGADLLAAGASAMMPSGLKPLPEPVIGGASPSPMRNPTLLNDEPGARSMNNCARCTAGFLETMQSGGTPGEDFGANSYNPGLPDQQRNIPKLNAWIGQKTALQVAERGMKNDIVQEGTFHIVHIDPFRLPDDYPIASMRGTAASPHVMVGWRLFGEIHLYDPQINAFWAPSTTQFIAFPTSLKF